MPFGFDKLATAAVIAALMFVAGERAQAQAPSVPASTPVCIYESESYSDGAYLCIRKGLMLGCASNAGKVNWSVVADRDLSRLCGDDGTRLAPRQRYTQRRRPVEAAAAPQVSAAPPVSGKCFSFNGKSYCE